MAADHGVNATGCDDSPLNRAWNDRSNTGNDECDTGNDRSNAGNDESYTGNDQAAAWTHFRTDDAKADDSPDQKCNLQELAMPATMPEVSCHAINDSDNAEARDRSALDAAVHSFA